MNARKTSLSLSLLPLLATGCFTTPIGQEQVTPQRPTVSYDTRTTSYGTFEVEAGASLDPGDRFDTPVTLKYGSGPDTEVSVGYSPFVRLDTAAGHESGGGDVVFGIRHRMWEEQEGLQALAVQTLVKLPAADKDKGLGTGEIDASFGGSLSSTVSYDTTIVAHYLLNFIGNPTESSDVGHTLAIAASAPIWQEGVTGWGELAGLFLPEDNIEVLLAQVGASYCPHPTVSYDAAVSFGLTDESPDFAVMVGITTNLGLYAPRADLLTPEQP